MIITLSNLECSPPFPRFGGKGSAANWYRAQLPPHLTYVEPFCGSAALLFAKPRSTVEVINDLDGDIYNFFCVLRDPIRSLTLADLVQKTPYSREEFERCRELRFMAVDPVEKARIFFVLCRQSFGSLVGQTWAYGRKSMKSFHSSLADFEPLCRRLQQVQVENRPAVDVIQQFDTPRTMFFVDPPYPHSTRVRVNGYDHEMKDQDHMDLLGQLLKVEGKVMLCGYPCPLYDTTLSHWRRVERPYKCSTGGIEDGNAQRPLKIEVIWMNYSAPTTGN